MDVDQTAEGTDTPQPDRASGCDGDGDGSGGDRMAARVRAFDWSLTPLGPMDRWPQALRTAVDVCLHSPVPMFVWWGPDLINVYNDAYAPVLGGRHPAALGQPARTIWSEIWPDIGADVDRVVKLGESVSKERVRFVMERNGYPEETFFSYAHSPIPDGRGGIGGLFQVCTDETARVRAEAAMREGEARLRALAATSGAVLYRMNADWSELQPLDGKGLVASTDAPIRDWLMRNIPESEHAAIRERIAHCIAMRLPFEMEHRVNRPDGSVGWTHSRAVPVLDDAGRVVEWVGTAEDVTERRQADERLRASEERFRRAMSIGTVGVLFFGLDGRIHDANAAFERMSGYAVEELRRIEDWSVLTVPEFLGPTATTAEALATTGVAAPYEKQMVRRDGSRWWGLFAPTRLSGHGRDAQCVEFIIDITHSKRSEAALQASEDRLRRMVNIEGVGVLTFDAATGTLLDANAWFLRMSGFTREEVAARTLTWRTMTPPEHVAESLRQMDLLATTGRIGPYEKEYFLKDGSRSWMLFAGAGVGDGTVIEYCIDISDRKRAEEARRAVEDRLRLTADAIPALVAYVDAAHRYQFVNAAYREWFGVGPEQVTGRHVRDAVGETTYGQRLEQIERALAGETVRFECPMFHAALGRRDTETTYVPDVTGDGVVRGFVVLVYDVSDRRRAAEERERLLRAVQSERANLATIIEQAPAFMATLRGPDHVVDLANEQYFRVVGRHDILGKAVRDALPEVVAQGFTDLLDGVYRTGEPYAGYEVPVVVGPPGAAQQRVLNFVYQAMRDADGSVSGVFVHGVDVTELVRSRQAATAREAALRTSEERLAFSVEAADLGTFYCPMPLGTIVWNDTCKEHFFLPPDAEVDFDTFYSILHPDDRERTRRAVEGAVFSRQPYDIEYRTVAPDGRVRWVRAKGRAYYGTDGNPTRFDGVTLDVTEQKQAEAERQALLDRETAARAEAERASRMKDEFLATLSHELRTPLNAILGWAQILRTGQSPEDVAEGVDVIIRNARVQVSLIEELLDVSRIVSGKVRLDVQQVQLTAVIEGAVEAVRPAAEAKGIRLRTVLDPSAGPVTGDPNRLTQIIFNLLHNATKYTPKGGQVQVVLERINSHVEISVTDNGEGLSSDFLPHVWERFRQADGSTTRRHGGLGLGLSIVKHLAELHGGRVQAMSRGPGLGSTFTISLPLMPVHPEPAAAVAEERRHPTTGPDAPGAAPDAAVKLSGLRVLVVDDEPDARGLVKRLLEDREAVVTSTGSAAEALEALRRDRPDVIVSDIGMPGEDGYSLIRKVRALDPADGGDVPAVALTAYARSEDRTRAMVAGFTGHVAKPVEPAELVATVASLAGRRRRS